MPIPERAFFEDDSQIDGMAENAKRASDFLKVLSHEGRLMILCYLASGPKSVKELEDLLSLRQPTVSQQLARLRTEGLISAKRDGKSIIYSISDPRARIMIEQLYDMFCADSDCGPNAAND